MKKILFIFFILKCSPNNTHFVKDDVLEDTINQTVQNFDNYLNLKYPNYLKNEDKMIAFLNDYEKLYTTSNNIKIKNKLKADYAYFESNVSDWKEKKLIQRLNNENIDQNVEKWLRHLNDEYKGKPFNKNSYNGLLCNLSYYFYLYHSKNSNKTTQEWIKSIVILQMSPGNAINSLRNPEIIGQLNSRDIKILFFSEFIITTVLN